MKRLIFPPLLLLVSQLGGCAYSVHDVYISSFGPFPKRGVGKMVRSEAEQFVVLGFAGNTIYLDQAYERLAESCPKGEIIGVKTEYLTALGLLSWTNKVFMQGFCVQPSSKRAAEDSTDDSLAAAEGPSTGP